MVHRLHISRKRFISILSVALVVAAAVIAKLGYPLAISIPVAVVAVLIPRGADWLKVKLESQKRSQRKITGRERRALIKALRDENENQLGLDWLKMLPTGTVGADGLPFNIVWTDNSGSFTGFSKADAVLQAQIDELLVGATETIRDIRSVAIVGDGGIGKTTMLRMVQRRLLDSAAADTNSPIPIILNCSTWSADKKGSLSAWVLGVACQREGTTLLPRAWDHPGAG